MQKDHQHNTMEEQARDRLQLFQREITYREHEVQQLRHKIKEKEMQTDAALVSDQLARHNAQKLKDEGDAKD